MEEVSIVFTKAQIARLCLLVKYEIKRNETLRDFVSSLATVDHCTFEIKKFSEILDKLMV